MCPEQENSRLYSLNWFIETTTGGIIMNDEDHKNFNRFRME